MRHPAADEPASAEQLEAELAARPERTLLRLIACGSAGDGTSTLIGRLLDDAGGPTDDQPAPAPAARCADGGVTYRHLAMAARDYLIADTPGDERYTRTVVTGASTADGAVIVADARTGLLAQTRRQAHVLALLGIRDVALAVNKLDLVGYSIDRFLEIEDAFRAFASAVGLERVACIPVSALRGDNVAARSSQIPGYCGPSLLEYLESLDPGGARMQGAALRMPVQDVSRAPDGAAVYTGAISSGAVRPGDRVIVAPAGTEAGVQRVIAPDGDVERAAAGQSISLTLTSEVDARRGDVIAAHDAPPGVADQFRATIIWMGEEPMLRGRTYLMRIGSATVPATVSPLKYKLSMTTLERLAATSLTCNEIGACDLELADRIAFDPYSTNRATGGFVLLDRMTGDTVGAGMIEFALRRSQNVAWQGLSIDRDQRARSLQQKPFVMWLTGLSGAGKSTIANLVEAELHRRGHHTYLLDGDNVRHGLNSDLGFTAADRVENIRRVAEVARLMVDAGLIVLVSFISPFRTERQMARSLFAPGEFFEIHVDAPLAVVERRDPKGLYRKARRGELRNFTGIDSPYEPPESPELTIATDVLSPPEAVERVIAMAERASYL